MTYEARPCDREGNFLPRGTPPPPLSDKTSDDWTPYKSRVEFELADYLFTKNQTPMHSIDQLLNIWAASLIEGGSKTTLFPDHRALYKTIDDTPLGDIKWQSFSVKYTGEIPEQGVAPWMTDTYDVWFRDPCNVVNNMLSNPDYAMEIDLQPYREYATENDERQWQDFMSGDWAWSQAVCTMFIIVNVHDLRDIFRIRFLRTQIPMAQRSCPSFSGVIRPLFRLQRGKMITTLSTHLLGMSRILFAVHTATLLPWWDSLQCQKVCAHMFTFYCPYPPVKPRNSMLRHQVFEASDVKFFIRPSHSS